MLIKNPNFLIFLFGMLMVLFALLVDILISSTAGMGFLQRAMLVIGGILLAFGLRRLVVPEQYKWDWLLAAVYLSGILFTGLQSNNNASLDYNAFLYMGRFNLQDLYVNIIGFAPLGFLVMAALSMLATTGRSIIVTLVLAVLASGSIEYLQYCCIPGRYSSGYDLLSNVGAAVLGILVYLGYARVLSSKD